MDLGISLKCLPYVFFLFKVIVLFIIVKANQLLQHWGSYFSFGNKTYVVMLIFFSRVFDHHLISFTFDVVKFMIIFLTSYIWNELLPPFLPCIFLCLVRSHIAITRAVTCIVCLCCHNFVQYFQLYNMHYAVISHIGHHTYIFFLQEGRHRRELVTHVFASIASPLGNQFLQPLSIMVTKGCCPDTFTFCWEG